MRHLILTAAVLATAGGAMLGLLPAAAASEPVPRCQPVLITTPWRQFTIQACDSGLRAPAPGKEWQWVFDGSAIKARAVVFGYQVPKGS